MMNYEKKNNLISIIYSLLIICFFLGTCWLTEHIQSSRELNKVRRQIDTYREQLADATNTCRELEATIGRCQQYCQEFGETANRNVDTIKDCIDIIEETREIVYCIEMELNNRSADELYSRFDSYLFDNEVNLP